MGDNDKEKDPADDFFKWIILVQYGGIIILILVILALEYFHIGG